jgi:3-hydroxybutyrate dehydrogenase
MKLEDAFFADRHAVVTGASRGIGTTIAAALAGRGARVSLLGRDAENLHTVSKALGGAAIAAPIVTDVTDSTSVRAAFEKAREHFGPVHILINNAGQAASAKFTDTDEALWNRIMAVNR